VDSAVIKHLALGAIEWGVSFPSGHLERFLEYMQLKTVLANLEINCVIDAGANRGQFATDLRRIGYKGAIASFEPVASEFAALRTRFHGDPGWRGFRVALGARCAEVEMHVVPGKTVMSSMLKPAQRWPQIDRERVEMRRLDELFDEACDGVERPRILLKMDTQGYDLEVFEGARGCLEHVFAVLSEVSIVPLYEGMPHYLEALRVYESAGFRLFHLSPVSRVPGGGLQELNCLMSK